MKLHLLPIATLVWLQSLVLPAAESLGEEWGTAEREAEYYRIVEIPIPDPLFVEAGCFATMPDGRIAVGTRRGDIYLVEGLTARHPLPKFHRFASGFDELLGLAQKDGELYATQATELTRVVDTDGDDRADLYETINDSWGFANYHEFALGSKFDKEGNIWIALGLSKSYHSWALFRGWALKITPSGEAIPVASGLRSPLGVGDNGHGAMIYAESQGPWNGACSLKHLKEGGFMGHPISYNWYEYAPNMGPTPVEPNSPSRLEIERKRVKELVPYAVVFPFRRMGRSISGFVLDETDGKFGPFGGQIFIGDHTLSLMMRATMEEINGVWQGACYPFREGFSTGILNCHFTPEGQLLSGGTNRGWPVRGAKENILERLDWTGKMPFEVKEINVLSDGFRLTFTKPVDKKTATNPESYVLGSFTHIYQSGYGSPEVDRTVPVVESAEVSEDGLEVRLKVNGMVQGHVHEFEFGAVRSTDDDEPLHRHAYYTLNEIPAAESAE
ncbi:MAG: hypothetical protein Q7Q71_01515 [Verrucomicrobiota bacterium JB023]|nr:hypothetical protein [Verrucomicrobiota bacterium JB023]